MRADQVYFVYLNRLHPSSPRRANSRQREGATPRVHNAVRIAGLPKSREAARFCLFFLVHLLAPL